MIFRSIFIIVVAISLAYVVFGQSEQGNPISLQHLKAKFPLISDEDASVWLSTRNTPHRWRDQIQKSDEIKRILKNLELLNENGIRQDDTRTFEGVSMEVIFEMVSKQKNG